MTRKLFIVAADNVADFRSLERAVGGESDVTVIYDRRRHHSTEAPEEERRRRTDVGEQLRSKGWAVVRLSGPEALEGGAAARQAIDRSMWRSI